MIGVVICTHASLSKALLEATEMIVGTMEKTEAVCVQPGDSGETIVDRLSEAMKAVDSGDGVMILCDMFGGTPSNVSLSLLGDDVEIVTGVNLPMLLKLTTCRTLSLKEVATVIQGHGRDNIMVAGALLKPRQDDK